MLEAAGAPVSESAWKIEPSPGQYDTAYLDATQERLNWFAEPPEWAIEDDDLPFEQHPVWSFNYFAPAVMAAFDNFFDYAGEHAYLQDHFADAWVEVVKRFKNHPAVLGYDILNEPSPGSVYAVGDITITQPDGEAAEFDRTLFTEFYERMIAAIRNAGIPRSLSYNPEG
mgnify:CR=1 FL=1